MKHATQFAFDNFTDDSAGKKSMIIPDDRNKPVRHSVPFSMMLGLLPSLDVSTIKLIGCLMR